MNKNIFNLVVIFLGVALLSSIAGVVALSSLEKPVDDILKQVIVGCLTGIAGLLARHPEPDHPRAQPVQITNTVDDAVPVTSEH